MNFTILINAFLLLNTILLCFLFLIVLLSYFFTCCFLWSACTSVCKIINVIFGYFYILYAKRKSLKWGYQRLELHFLACSGTRKFTIFVPLPQKMFYSNFSEKWECSFWEEIKYVQKFNIWWTWKAINRLIIWVAQLI